eukprot:scaffold3405_cov167-Amphora_coffeaeformis.AAC.4
MSYYFGPRLFDGYLPDKGPVLVNSPIFRLPEEIESLPDQAFELLVEECHYLGIPMPKQSFVGRIPDWLDNLAEFQFW